MDISDLLKKHIYVFSSILLCLCYSYLISSSTRKGFFRLVFLLPAICLLPILPLHLPHLVCSVLPTTSVAWLITGRLILFAFGKGPLLSAQSLHSFIINAAVNLRSPSSRFPSKPTKLNTFGLEVLALAILTGTVERYKQDLHPNILLLSYFCFTFLSLDCYWAIANYIQPKFMGLDVEPLFHEPYLSTSLQDFWGRRWNLTVSDQLRHMVYNPVNSLSAPVPAYLATFLASGLMHELLYYYGTRAPPSWEMTLFFVVHGIAVVLEVRLKRAFKGRLDFPRFVSVALTLGFVIWTSLWLYFPPLIKGGLFDMAFKELQNLVKPVCGFISLIQWNQ